MQIFIQQNQSQSSHCGANKKNLNTSENNSGNYKKIQQPLAMVAQATSNEQVLFNSFSWTWILDIGANHHMTSEGSQVPNDKPYLGHDGFLQGNVLN